MSVFAAAAAAVPPRYPGTTSQPPPYKSSGSQPLSTTSNPLSMPPPVYRTTSNTTATSPRSSFSAQSISTIAPAEPPQYASIISAPRPIPQPTATRQPRSSTPTWKDPYVETDAADSVYELQQRNSRQRTQEEEEEEEEEDDTKNWCWGCFWVGPSVQQPWVAHLVL
jgi:hypothetical protein